MTPAQDVLINTQTNPSEKERIEVEAQIWNTQNADADATSVVLTTPPTTQMTALSIKWGYVVDGSTVIWTHDSGIIGPEDEEVSDV